MSADTPRAENMVFFAVDLYQLNAERGANQLELMTEQPMSTVGKHLPPILCHEHQMRV